MVRFFLNKLKESSGPLKATRQLVADVLEELLDIVDYYLRETTNNTTYPADASKAAQHSRCEEVPIPGILDISEDKSSPSDESMRKKQARRTDLKRTIDVPQDLASALEIASNRKKQEFKVLAILFDADNRGLGNLSAKQLSEHGERLGLAIRHENVRKVIRMRLENYVDIMQNRQQGSPIYNYKITEDGIAYFREKYLKTLFTAQ